MFTQQSLGGECGLTICVISLQLVHLKIDQLLRLVSHRIIEYLIAIIMKHSLIDGIYVEVLPDSIIEPESSRLPRVTHPNRNQW